MQLFSGDFFSALAAIVVIDLVLAGDNAIVIALAARNLPAALRKRAVVWGTVGAIVVRTAMTLVVVWLLKVPGLHAIGGALLVWIAYKLVIDTEGNEESKLHPADNFWAAMKTIVVADALMGLDNVLAVAGASQGSFVLVVMGLLISIPIVIGGSQLLLKLVVRYPVIVYVGAGVLAWTAVKMIASEPLLHAFVARNTPLVTLAYIAVICGVLAAGFFVNRRKVHERISAHLVSVSPDPTVQFPISVIKTGATAMNRILLPIDGSVNSLNAARHAVNRFLAGHDMEVHLLHVRPPFSRHVARFSSPTDRAAYHREKAEKALAPARELLKRFALPHSDHVAMGDRADTIVRIARELGVSEIVMGTARKNSLTRLIEDSVTYKVLESADVPVEVVAGDAVSKLERFGVPAGVAAALMLLVVAVD